MTFDVPFNMVIVHIIVLSSTNSLSLSFCGYTFNKRRGYLYYDDEFSNNFLLMYSVVYVSLISSVYLLRSVYNSTVNITDY